MLDLLNRLITALRHELEEYGEMLALLDAQQEFVLQRAAQNVVESIAGVDVQGTCIHRARNEREERRTALSRQLGLADEASFAQLIPQLPKDYRPLVEALVSENNELLVRVQQRARQNHLLLTRTVELMQRFLSNFLPPSAPTVYTGHGDVLNRAPTQALYEAVG